MEQPSTQEVKTPNCFMLFLKTFDYFGVNFSFKIKDKEKYQSSFGGLIFILFLALVLIYIVITFLIFLRREVYNINNSITVIKPAPQIGFQNTSFSIGFALVYDDDTFPDPSILNYFNLSITNTMLQNSVKTKTLIPYKKCELTDFYNQLNTSEFNFLKLSNFTCPIIDQNTLIRGTFTDNIYQYLELAVSIRDDTLSNNSAVTMDFLKNFLATNPMKVVLYWIDTTVNVGNFTSPISTYIRTYVSYVDFSTIRKINMDFGLIKFSSDSDVIFQSYKNSSNVTFSISQEYSLISTNRTGLSSSLGKTLVKMFIRSSSSNLIIDRAYQKIPNYLANVGGLIGNILLILVILVGFVNQFWAEQSVMNTMFKYREHLKSSHPEHYDIIKLNLRGEGFQNKRSNINIQVSEPNKQVYKSESEDINEANKLQNNTANLKIVEIELNEKPNFPDTPKTNHKKVATVNHAELYSRKGKLNKEEEALLADSEKPLSFNPFEIFWRFCPCKTRKLELKNSLFEKSYKKMEYYFDIYTYFKKIQEIDILKYLLLDKNQVKLFNFLSRPSVSLAYSDSDEIYQKEQQNRNNTADSYISIEDLNEIIQSYKKLMTKNEKLNEKLFYLFDYEIDHLIIE